MAILQCFLVVITDNQLPEIPARFAQNSVKMSGDHACIVGSDGDTTEEIASSFGVSLEGMRGIVIRLTTYSGSEKSEIVDAINRLKEE